MTDLSSARDAEEKELEGLLRTRKRLGAGTPEQRRRLDEQVDYWRQRAGWFDDDAKMQEYNKGVYDTYYQYDDDGRARGGGRHRGHAKAVWVKNGLKVLCVLVALGLSALMFRAIMRRLGTTSKKDKKRSESRSRSKSKGRSRSRSRSRRGGRSGTDYSLMDDDNKSSRSKRSTRSNRSSSRRRSSRSRSRARSRSKGRRTNSDAVLSKDESPPASEPVLV